MTHLWINKNHQKIVLPNPIRIWEKKPRKKPTKLFPTIKEHKMDYNRLQQFIKQYLKAVTKDGY